MSDYTTPFPGEFAIDDVWTAIQDLLSSQLDSGVDVDCIGEKDFDEEGMLTVTPPAARVLFLGEVTQPFDTQMANYNASQGFAVICADEDLGPDPQEQRLKSIRLLGQVKHILTGARLSLSDETVTEPVVYVKADPLPTSNTGMAYIAQFVVGNIAQFAAPNASPEVQ